MQRDSDGGFTFVVAHRDPGVPNWLDTEGRAMGNLYWRYLLSTGDIERPVCEVVSIDDVAAKVASYA